MAFPTQRLVIGVLVGTWMSWVKEHHGHGSGHARFDLPVVAGNGGHLNRHAWVALVALVVAAWWFGS